MLFRVEKRLRCSIGGKPFHTYEVGEMVDLSASELGHAKMSGLQLRPVPDTHTATQAPERVRSVSGEPSPHFPEPCSSGATILDDDPIEEAVVEESAPTAAAGDKQTTKNPSPAGHKQPGRKRSRR